MRTVTMDMLAAHVAPERAFQRISDFAAYPDLTDAVERVVVHPPEPDGAIVSEWLVHFRKGLLHWTERDVINADDHTISFTQTAGDFDVFEGRWVVTAAGQGSRVLFDAVFDLGMPTLAELLDPVAEATLRGNILKIVGALLGTVEEAPALEPVAGEARR